MNSNLDTTDFSKGDRVIYVPDGVKNLQDPRCEFGKVSSTNSVYVFVKFNKNIAVLGEDAPSKACAPTNLHKVT